MEILFCRVSTRANKSEMLIKLQHQKWPVVPCQSQWRAHLFWLVSVRGYVYRDRERECILALTLESINLNSASEMWDWTGTFAGREARLGIASEKTMALAMIHATENDVIAFVYVFVCLLLLLLLHVRSCKCKSVDLHICLRLVCCNGSIVKWIYTRDSWCTPIFLHPCKNASTRSFVISIAGGRFSWFASERWRREIDWFV